MAATPDSTLANPERLIADLQRQLAEREAELDDRQAECNEALAREAATADVLQVINSSPGDLTPVFDAVLERALCLCEAAFGMLWIYDGEAWEAVALRQVPAEFAEFLRGPQRPSSDTAHGRIARGETLVHIADVAAEELYRTGDPHRSRLVDLAGARTFLVVPMRNE